MKTQLKILSKKKSITLAVGLLAAIVVACTSVFQFSLTSIDTDVDKSEVAQTQGDNDNLQFGAPRKADNSTDSQKTVYKIQAVSQGIQLHVTYSPIVWESFDIDLPEFKAEIPQQLYKAGWEYFRVLFTDIIAANAP
tara:strand:+ start:1371 stop:1781 length:411 start_codon:yes stop_codon:yes gene_type:complete